MARRSSRDSAAALRADAKTAVALAQGGASVKDIAVDLKRSRDQVREWLAPHGLCHGDSGVRYGADAQRKALKLAKAKVPVAQISAQLGPSEKTIRNWMKKAKVVRRGNPRQYNRRKILEDLDRMSRTKVRNKHGCSNTFLTKLLQGKIAP